MAVFTLKSLNLQVARVLLCLRQYSLLSYRTYSNVTVCFTTLPRNVSVCQAPCLEVPLPA